MLNKKLIIGIVVIIAFIVSILAVKTIVSKIRGKGPAARAQAKSGLKKSDAAKKIISKGKGALKVNILNSKNAEIPMKVRMFRANSSTSSIYAASTVGGRTQELLPGTYDLEVDTAPQKIFKNIRINEGKETVANLGCVTGSLLIKALNAKKSPAYYPLRILYSRTNDMVTTFMTNKPLEIVPGVYDIEIGVLPRQHRKDVRVNAGKESVIDLGCLTGTLMVKVTGADKKEARYTIRVITADTNEIISSGRSNKPIELGAGRYNIEVLSYPRQSKKDVVINAGEESAVEFTVNTAPSTKSK